MKKIILSTLACGTLLIANNLTLGKQAFENKQYKKAHSSFLKSAQEGMVAKYNLGLMYELGLGVEKNIKTALKFYTLSANDGYSKAQNSLGNAHLKGIGVKKDINTAIQYLKLAAKQNNKDAITTLKQIDKQLKQQKADLAYVTIRSNVLNDKVYINGKYVGKTKLTIPLNANTTHKIEVRKDGYQTYHFKDINLKPKEKRTIRAILKK